MRILLTGSKGTIGTVLLNGLPGIEFVPFDLPEHDARNLADLTKAAQGCHGIIHLAWNMWDENFRNKGFSVDNGIMFSNVYEACVAAKVPKILLASSIHANRPAFLPNHPITSEEMGIPDSPYGANKLLMEKLGASYAEKHGIDVTCVRFGGVNTENVRPTSDPFEEAVWLSHEDLLALIEKWIKSQVYICRHVVMHATSYHESVVYDLDNPFRWEPKND
jgi:nucleoside-diphosphate-sugar epimerase